MRAISADALTPDVFYSNAADNRWYAKSIPASLDGVDGEQRSRKAEDGSLRVIFVLTNVRYC